PLAVALLARAVDEQDRPEEALELTRTSEELSPRDDVLAQVHWRTARARVLSRGEELAEAERLAREAQALAASTDWVVARGDAAFTLGIVLRAGGRRRDAYQAFTESLCLYERKGARLLAAAARSALDERPAAAVRPR